MSSAGQAQHHIQNARSSSKSIEEKLEEILKALDALAYTVQDLESKSKK